ncbi:MAG: bacterial/archaeal transporter family protein [Clostridiales bacterium]|nr:bacterial/archaeal transporter family protein [Clostridiales bacterium]
MWILFGFGSAFFAGITSILAKYGLEDVDSRVATALRTVIILLFSWLLVFVTGSAATLGEIGQRTWIFLILSGFATGGSWLCYFRALQIGDVNKVTPIDKSSTVLTMLLAMIFLQESVTIFKIFAMILIGLGTFLMIQRKEGKLENQLDVREEKSMRRSYEWMIAAFGSTIFASLTSILGKIGIEGVNSTLGTAIRTVVVLLMAWIVVFFSGKQATIKAIQKRNWWYLMLSGIATGASWLCYYRALQLGDASVVVPIDKLSILITIAFSYLILKESLPKRAILGLVGIVAGTLLLLI